MDYFFPNPERNIQLEDLSEDCPPEQILPTTDFKTAAQRLLQKLTDPDLDVERISDALAPDGDIDQKETFKDSIREDIRAIRRERSILPHIKIEAVSELERCKRFELHISEGEIRGIEAPPQGLTLVVETKEEMAYLSSFEGKDKTATISFSRRCQFFCKYRGVVILGTGRSCQIVTYKREPFPLSTVRPQLTNSIYKTYEVEEIILLDDSSAEPTLLSVDPHTQTLTRLGEVLNNAPLGKPPQYRLEKMLEINFPVSTNHCYCTIQNSLENFVVDEFGRFWILDDRELKILGPDFILLQSFRIQSNASIHRGPLGKVWIYIRRGGGRPRCLKYIP